MWRCTLLRCAQEYRSQRAVNEWGECAYKKVTFILGKFVFYILAPTSRQRSIGNIPRVVRKSGESTRG